MKSSTIFTMAPPGLDPEIEYEAIDSLLGSDYGEKSIRSSEEIYPCEKES